MSKKENQNYDNVHWADYSAKKVLEMFPNEDIYYVASGVTPSGIIHVGHFREIITTELVRRSLDKKGKKTKFIYSWDSYDVFRKVPKNIPSQWEKYLRLPVSQVPDPFRKAKSFGEFYMQEAEEILKVFEFPIEFQRQHQLQTSGIYADDIKKALNNREKVREILDFYRKEPLKVDWFPLSLYCEKCGKDTTKISNYDEDYTLDYVCECGFKNTINFKTTPIVKLPWRLDWPMRWNHYKISFEPGGKDHSSPGSSYDTGRKIIKEVYNREAPVYTSYNFIAMKGMGGKVSSSSGNGATISDVLEVYTSELVLFLFAGTRPNAEFDISFDMDVIKIYEDFEKLERIYYGLEEESNPKKLANLKRIYELSMFKNEEPQKSIPFQIGFKTLSNIVQANDFDYDRVEEYFKDKIKTDFDRKRLKDRFLVVKNWLEKYAPEDMKFTIQKNINLELTDKEKNIILDVKNVLIEVESSNDLFFKFKEITSNNDIQIKDFFKLMYMIIINKEKGPKLASFMVENKSKILDLLEQVN
ncbi:MAG: lysine--tRNA ligase [Nanoarchaeota archaeon]